MYINKRLLSLNLIILLVLLANFRRLTNFYYVPIIIYLFTVYISHKYNNFKVDKKILHKLKKLRKSLGKQVAFLFNHIDYYPVTIQEILKKNGIIKKTTSWSY